MERKIDNQVQRSLEKWPDVPACYGWLALDRRGRWLIQGEEITHRRSIEFLGRNYQSNVAGQWFVQNGPQRAFCTLEYTPWVYHLAGGDTLSTHTNEAVKRLSNIYLDDRGNVLLYSEHGIGVLIDRDLTAFIDILERMSVIAAKENDLLDLLSDPERLQQSPVTIAWAGADVQILSARYAEVAKQFGFVMCPQPSAD